MGYYVKLEIADGMELKVQIYGDEFYTICPKCGKEEQSSVSELAEVEHLTGDLSGSIYCSACSNKK